MQEALQAEKGRLQQLLVEEEGAVLAAEAQHPTDKSTAPGTGNKEEKDGTGKKEEDGCMQAEAEDELDAFMGQVAVQLEHDKVWSRFVTCSHVIFSHLVFSSHIKCDL